jgi:hypothetical protein
VDVPHATYVEGILGVYELTRPELLADVFTWAYQRSVSRYTAVLQTVGEPDPFRLRYRSLMKIIVYDVVMEQFTPAQTAARVQEFAEARVPPGDLRRFIALIQTELRSLHEGNIARYRLRLETFLAWKRAARRPADTPL